MNLTPQVDAAGVTLGGAAATVVRMKTRATLFLCTLTLAACASMGGYRPTVDPYNDPKPERIAQDEHECEQLAKEASGGTAKEATVGGAVGGLLGAASGAAVGAAFGSAGTGAAVGAAAGGLGGGTYKGLSAEEKFKQAFRTCMRNRGHNVID